MVKIGLKTTSSITIDIVTTMTMGAMTILSQQYGSDNGDNGKSLKSVKNNQKISEKPQIFNFLFRFFLKKLIFRSFCWILTKKGKKGIFLTFFTTFLQFSVHFWQF